MTEHAPSQFVQRYKRTDQDRLGSWACVDASWKSPASPGLVAHDMYHHLPTDVGTFAQEVLALGAEWYIDIQSLEPVNELPLSLRALERFQRNVSDTVLNALDARERRPFHLPPTQVQALSASEMNFFQDLAARAAGVLASSQDPRALDHVAFELRFVEHLLAGYHLAKARFADQAVVRKASLALVRTLQDLDESEVPIGHEIVITLEGYHCRVAYDDADAEFLSTRASTEAFMMLWCSLEQGYPCRHLTLHRSARDYAEYTASFLARQETQALSEDQQFIPQGEQHALSKVYLRDARLQAQMAEHGHLCLPISLLHAADRSPRGVWVF